MTSDLAWTVINSGAITTETIQVGTHYNDPYKLYGDIERRRQEQTERERNAYMNQLKPSGHVEFVEEEIVPTVPYKVLHEEPRKPYMTVELLEDLEYGVYDLETESIIRTIPLDKDEAIRVTNEFNRLHVVNFVQDNYIKINVPEGVEPKHLWFDLKGRYVGYMGDVANVPIGKMTEASKTFAKVFLAVVWPAYILFALFVMIRSWF